MRARARAGSVQFIDKTLPSANLYSLLIAVLVWKMCLAAHSHRVNLVEMIHRFICSTKLFDQLRRIMRPDDIEDEISIIVQHRVIDEGDYARCTCTYNICM